MDRAGLLHHVEMYCSNLDASKKFWSWFLMELGYFVYQEWSHGISFKLGETYLVFVQTEDRFLDVPYHRCRTGLNHLAFHGKSAKHIDEITQKLKERGINILYQDRHPRAGGGSSYGVFFEDPDRIKVELTVDG